MFINISILLQQLCKQNWSTKDEARESEPRVGNPDRRSYVAAVCNARFAADILSQASFWTALAQRSLPASVTTTSGVAAAEECSTPLQEVTSTLCYPPSKCHPCLPN